MAVKTLKPGPWEQNGLCKPKCSVHESRIGVPQAKMVHSWYEEGLNDQEIEKNAFIAGMTLSAGALGRHRKNHIVKLGENPSGEVRLPQRKLTDLEIIDLMIESGGRRAGQFKMTPSETIKAMEMKYKLTQGSAFEGMLDALNRAAMEEDDIEPMPGDPSMADTSGDAEDDNA